MWSEKKNGRPKSNKSGYASAGRDENVGRKLVRGVRKGDSILRYQSISD